jgi:hypothetical protein
MTIIPCKQNEDLRKKIEEFAEVLKTEAHKLGGHGLNENEFYHSGLFRGAIERIRGQYSANMRDKREFMQHILNNLQDRDFIKEWESAGENNRHDYIVYLKSGKIAAIEAKGGLDGNNTNIYERPPNAQEFIIWSLSTNAGGDPQRNVWSGIHTRLSADIISRQQQIDGLVVWDMVCGTIGRPCPKIMNDLNRASAIGPHSLPPPCIYILPATIPSPRNNPHPPAQKLEDIEFLKILNKAFGGKEDEINYVDFEVSYKGSDILRTTRVTRNNIVVKTSKPTAIRRS